MDHPPLDTRPPRVEAAWRRHHRHLQSVSQRLVGDRQVAEDLVQEAFARLAAADVGAIDDIGGWLAVVVRRLGIDHLRAAATRHETAAADPVPVQPAAAAAVDPADRVTLDDEVQQALAVVLDRLTPAERTAFILHDVFGLPFDTVADITGRSSPACRQLATRARRAVRDAPPDVTPIVPRLAHHELTDRFITACTTGDLAALLRVLDPDVDGVAAVSGAEPFVRAAGRDEVARRLIALFAHPERVALVPVPLEREVGIAAVFGGRTRAIICLEVNAAGDAFHHIRSVLTR